MILPGRGETGWPVFPLVLLFSLVGKRRKLTCHSFAHSPSFISYFPAACLLALHLIDQGSVLSSPELEVSLLSPSLGHV